MSAPDNSLIKFYNHGRFRVAGGVLPNAITAYQTFGDKSNPCIVFPTCYGGKLDGRQTSKTVIFQMTQWWQGSGLLDQAYMIGEEKVQNHFSRPSSQLWSDNRHCSQASTLSLHSPFSQMGRCASLIRISGCLLTLARLKSSSPSNTVRKWRPNFPISKSVSLSSLRLTMALISLLSHMKTTC